MSGKFDGRVALVTGAGSGIGRESALRLAEDGAAVMCADLNAEAAEGTAGIIQNRGGKAEPLRLDVTDEEAVQASLAQTVNALGGLDVIFNNAGVASGELTWAQTISVNLTGVFYGLTHGAPYLATRGGGVIINTASVAGLVGLQAFDPEAQADARLPVGAAAYTASKHGVVGLTRQFAVAFGAQGVRVNAIAPGYIVTPMTAELREAEGGEAGLVSLHPMGRLGQPEEVAAVVAFLASNEASFVNGAIVPIDGGYTAQ